MAEVWARLKSVRKLKKNAPIHLWRDTGQLPVRLASRCGRMTRYPHQLDKVDRLKGRHCRICQRSLNSRL